MADGNVTGDTFAHDWKTRNSVRVSCIACGSTSLSAIKRQMISDGAIRVGELHFEGPVRDEGDNPTELEGKL